LMRVHTYVVPSEELDLERQPNRDATEHRCG
jgi:hypothetical protein